MSERNRDIKQMIEGAPSLELTSVGGSWKAKVSYTRKKRTPGYEFVELTFTDVYVWDLRCLARSLQGALDDIAGEYDSLKKAMDVSGR